MPSKSRALVHCPVAVRKVSAAACFFFAVSKAVLLFGQSSDSVQAAKRNFPVPISSELPYDVDIQKVREMDQQGNIAGAQREFDILAWQAFLALNWPATANGAPDKSKSL